MGDREEPERSYLLLVGQVTVVGGEGRQLVEGPDAELPDSGLVEPVGLIVL